MSATTDCQGHYCHVPHCTRYAKEFAMCLFHSRRASPDFLPATVPDPLAPNATYCHAPTEGAFGRPPPPLAPRNHQYLSNGMQCRFPHCASYARTRGFCTRHGGGRKCRIADCWTPAQTGGLCRIHGGGSRCRVAYCTKFARARGLCSLHLKDGPPSPGSGPDTFPSSRGNLD